MSLRAIDSNDSMSASPLRAALSFHRHPVILCLLLTLCLDMHPCLAESLLNSPDGQRLLVDVNTATTENDTDSHELAEAMLAAQIRVASMGSKADEMLAQMTVEEIDRWRAGDPNALTGTQGIPLSSLIFLVSFDPQAPKSLLDPLMSWVDAAAAGKIHDGFDITQRAALYINKWGTPEQKARVKADTDIMLKSSDFQTRTGGEEIMHGLAGYEVGRVPRALGVPFSDYCSWAASYALHIRSKEPLPPVEVRSRWRLEPDKLIKQPPIIAQVPSVAPPLPIQKNSYWQIITLGMLVLLGGVSWIVLRRRTRHR